MNDPIVGAFMLCLIAVLWALLVLEKRAREEERRRLQKHIDDLMGL